MNGGDDKDDIRPPELPLDDQAGPAARLPSARADAMIASALEAAGYDEGDERAVVPVPATAHRRGWLSMAAAVVLAVVGAGSASAAVMWWANRREAAPVEQNAAAPAPRPPRPAPVATPAEDVVEAHEEFVEQAPETAAPTPRRRARRAAPQAPDDLLEEANKLRSARRWREADRAYARVWQRDPESRAAYVARVAAADLRLTHLGNPRGALGSYRAALRSQPAGPLSEEIRYGMAEAHRARADDAAERSALETFLKRHPRSGLAPRARRRLQEL